MAGAGRELPAALGTVARPEVPLNQPPSSGLGRQWHLAEKGGQALGAGTEAWERLLQKAGWPRAKPPCLSAASKSNQKARWDKSSSAR